MCCSWTILACSLLAMPLSALRKTYPDPLRYASLCRLPGLEIGLEFGPWRRDRSWGGRWIDLVCTRVATERRERNRQQSTMTNHYARTAII
ncbi:hypothetical protein B0H65DRAFT_76199 [Neurospora tetraspora]|uniref:Secreted protein n=1 Tax=Neurospora tetraspora TaxID=94610 RepID=A0AAE0J085_9PEZI|nr:hypothetical protein B0H65DRAFT_76199 [Neurospora tetraspora]